MNPYVITKIPFKPSKEDFFASELHKKIIKHQSNINQILIKIQ